MKRILTMVTLATMITLTGCQSMGPRQSGGSVAGAVIGGLLGSQFGSGDGRLVGTAVGVIFGGLLGGEIGRSMDEHNYQRTQHVLETNANGATSQWQNPNNGRKYEATPIRTWTDSPDADSRKYCREFILRDATVAGSNQQVYGTACRQPDGTWEMQNQRS